MWYINGTRLDDRIVRTDWDAGFIEGRQYGRGKSGGQVRTLGSFSQTTWSYAKLTVASFPDVLAVIVPLSVNSHDQ